MFAITKKTDYAIIALSYMARNPDAVCTAREISDRFRVPPALLMNVLKTMCHRALVRSVRGAKGGYALARPAAELSLAQIITAVEGPSRVAHCVGEHAEADPPCDLQDVCPVRRPVGIIHRRLEAFLREISLAEIARDAAAGDRDIPITLGASWLSAGSMLPVLSNDTH